MNLFDIPRVFPLQTEWQKRAGYIDTRQYSESPYLTSTGLFVVNHPLVFKRPLPVRCDGFGTRRLVHSRAFVHHMIGQAINKSKNKSFHSFCHGSHSHTTDLCLIIPVLMAVIPEALIIEVCVDSLQSAITSVIFWSRESRLLNERVY